MGRRTLQEVWRERAKNLRAQADELEKLANKVIVIDLSEPGAEEALRKVSSAIYEEDRVPSILF